MMLMFGRGGEAMPAGDERALEHCTRVPDDQLNIINRMHIGPVCIVRSFFSEAAQSTRSFQRAARASPRATPAKNITSFENGTRTILFLLKFNFFFSVRPVFDVRSFTVLSVLWGLVTTSECVQINVDF